MDYAAWKLFIDAAELGTGNSGNSVKPRQSLIDKGVVGVQKGQDRAVVADEIFDEQFGFTPHGLA